MEADADDVEFSKREFDQVLIMGQVIWSSFQHEVGNAKDWPEPTKTIEVNGKKFLLVRKLSEKQTVVFTLKNDEFKELAKLKGWRLRDSEDVLDQDLNQGALRIDTSVPLSQEIEELIKSGDLVRLFEIFGSDRMLSFLSRVHHVPIKEIEGPVRKHIDFLLDEHSGEAIEPRQRFSFIRMRHVQFPQEAGSTYENLLTQELIRSVYHNITNDHHFLETLLKESANEKNSPLLRRVYKNIHDYYTAIINLSFKWLNEDRMHLTLYEKEGIKFLMDKKRAILADDQGTGKTIQALMAAMNIRNGQGAKKVLIIAPRTAKKDVWEKQIKETIKGDQKVVVLDKNSLVSDKKRQELAEARFVITHYDAIIDLKGEKNALREELQGMEFDVVIVDEAHKIRNESLRTEAVKGFDAEYKFLLSGTPIVGRNVKKIYHLLNWLYPEKFPSIQEFLAKYDGPAEKMRQLREDISGFLIRRLKKDVLNLPTLHQIIVPVVLNPAHREAYERVQNDFKNWMSHFGLAREINKAVFLAKFMRCRQAAIDPLLVEDVIVFDDGKIQSVARFTDLDVLLDGKYYRVVKDIVTGEPLELINQHSKERYAIKKYRQNKFVMIGQKRIGITTTRDISSSKYEELDKLIERIKIQHPNDKVLVFSTFRDVVNKVARRYREHGTSSLLGGLSRTEVSRRIQEFHDEDGQTIFTVTVQTGGESISLTPANHVIFINDPLTYQEKKQAIDRIYRWLQEKEVYAYTLLANDTFDEHVASIIAEGKVITDLIFDEDPAARNLTDELIDKLLKRFSYPQEVIDQILAFRFLSKPNQQVFSEAPLVVENKGQSLSVNFHRKNFKAVLTLKNGERKQFDSFNSLLEEAKELSLESQVLLKESFQKQLSYDIDNKIPIKNTMLWNFIQTLIPQMKHVDYSGVLEQNIEVGMVILDLLMTNPNMTLENLSKHVDQLAVSKALDFLDRNNVFKALSLIGVLSTQYYYNGQLLSYAKPIAVFYKDRELTYQDTEIVNKIVPNRKIKIQEGGVKLSSLAQQYRKLTREEEIRLAIEAHKHNVEASRALLEHNLPLIIQITKSVFKKIQKTRTSLRLTDDDLEDVYQQVIQKLYKVMGRYGVEAAERTFREFFGGLIAKEASKLIHEKANLDQTELLTLDEEISPDSEVTRVDMLEAPSQDEEGEVENDERELKETIIYKKMEEILKKADFQDWEIDIFTQFVELGGIDNVVDTHGQSKTSITDIVSEAKSILKSSGAFGSGSDEETEDMAMASKGGIDFNADKMNLQTQNAGQDIKFQVDPAMLKQLQDAPGFTPVIINIQPVHDLRLFLEIK